MQKIILSVLIGLTLFVLPVAAGDWPKAEVFGGYQYTRIGGMVGANGWNASVTGCINRWFGVTADFGGIYKSEAVVKASATTYTFGPVFSLRNKRATPFVHALFGGFRVSSGFLGGNLSTNGFASIIGGGVDVKVTPHVAIRAIQADWILWRTQGLTEEKNARLAAGIVFRF